MKKKIAGLIMLFMLLGGVAYAAIPDSSGVIHGCYKTSGPAKGALIVIDSDVETCPSGTVSLNWNQIGPVGPQGPAGATGPAGETGPTGPEGPAGPAGTSLVKFIGPGSFTWSQSAGSVGFFSGTWTSCSDPGNIVVSLDGKRIGGWPQSPGFNPPDNHNLDFVQSATGEQAQPFWIEPSNAAQHSIGITSGSGCVVYFYIQVSS